MPSLSAQKMKRRVMSSADLLESDSFVDMLEFRIDKALKPGKPRLPCIKTGECPNNEDLSAGHCRLGTVHAINAMQRLLCFEATGLPQTQSSAEVVEDRV